MPIVDSNYIPPRFFFNRHIETIYPALFRGVAYNAHTSIDIETPDDDFLQFDWYKKGNNKKVVIISHGLEGNSSKPYIKGMVNAFTLAGWDAIAWNYRGCGARMNKREILYHSGASYDLETMVEFAKKNYDKIFLIGFSLGGNITLKYLGEKERQGVLGACTLSVPIDLYSCSRELEKSYNIIYAKRFLYNLKAKVRKKGKMLNGLYPLNRLSKINTLFEFDDIFTAPMHGFNNAMDYYKKSSSKQFLSRITVPTLLINADNDPFLTNECFPLELSERHPHLFFENPAKGGHVGFCLINNKNIYWSEKRAVEFANSLELE